MASFDFGSKSAYKFAFSAEINNASANSAAIDTQGFEGVAFVTTTGVSNLNATIYLETAFLEGDDTNISNASNVAASRVTKNPKIIASNTSYWSTVTPTKRYLFARFDNTGEVLANVAGTGALGFPAKLPT